MAKKSDVSPWATQTATAWAGELERVGKLVKVGMSEKELIKVLGKPVPDSGVFYHSFAFAARRPGPRARGFQRPR